MILYFANRQMTLIGQASTTLPKGLRIVDDSKVDDVESGVASLEFYMPFDDDTRAHCEECAAEGNYILLNRNGKDEFYTIIDCEVDTKRQEVLVYAEDAGLDLLNAIVGEYEADKAYSIAHYINLFTADSGFTIGINEVSKLTRTLKWEGEETAAARVASVAKQFDGCEISFSFKIEHMTVTEKKINIHKERGADYGVTLRLNQDVDRIITKKSIANLATALEVTGGTPEDTNLDDDVEPSPITLKGYTYDDGDFYISGTRLLSRKALKKWRRYMPDAAPSSEAGHICRPYSYDTLSQQELFSHALTELKSLCDTEVNYEVELSRLPDNVRIGDRINIVDEAGGLYLSTRVLKIAESECTGEHKVTLGEHLIKSGGISQKVADLAAQFAKMIVSAARALSIANNAKTAANAAQEQANAALQDAATASQVAQDAQTAADTATQSAAEALAAANDAQAAVDVVENDVASLETTVDNAQAAAEQAQQAAATAQTKADEAHTAAVNAGQKADEAATAAETAQTKADEATTKADAAQSAAGTAQTKADEASTTAAAAKLDAEQAQKDIDALGDDLTTLSNTMSADYARKTDLTEATASLQTQITQNAAEISSTASKVQTIDETANDAAEKADAAQSAAAAAQEQADAATAEAQAAANAAKTADDAAKAAQSEADAAKAAAETAQSVADQAEADLDAAKADLATVKGRVDATESDIAAAQAAVNTAQAAADKAKADAATAEQKAVEAQNTADDAVANAAAAQTTANDAASAAALAQQTADAAKGDAAAAQQTAKDAADAAAEAQRTADSATTAAQDAKDAAQKAADDAAQAVEDAEAADQQAAQAADDLVAAKQRLNEVLADADATEAEVEAAQADVDTAQAAADAAMENATIAAAHAAQAKINAANAQKAADDAQAQADAAQKAADDAQAAADKAQADVDALAVRVTKAETDISQTNEAITLLATKEEVAQTLGGYYTTTETDAAISVKADEINSTVESKFQGLQIGGRNLLLNSNTFDGNNISVNMDATIDGTYQGLNVYAYDHSAVESGSVDILQFKQLYPERLGAEYTLSFYARGSGTMFTYFYGATGYLQCATVTQSTGQVTHAGDGNSEWFLTDEWTRYWVTWTLADEGDISIEKYVLFRLLAGASVELCGIKLEKGNKASDWSPAPEDMASIGDLADYATKSEVTQTADSITSTVRAEYKEAISDIDVGGRNLIAGTSKDTVYSGNMGEDTYKDVWFGETIEPPDGSEYIVSFDAKADVAQDIKCFFYAPNTTVTAESSTGQTRSGGDGQCSVSITTEWARYWVRWTQTAATDTKDVIVGRNETTNDIYIRAVKFEQGNKATDWTPAPEDMATADELGNVSDEAAGANTTAADAVSRVAVAETDILQLKDMIATLVINGDKGSAMTQTADGWQFDIGEIMRSLTANSDDVASLSGDLDGANSNIEAIQQAVKDLGATADYVRIEQYNGQPCLVLGEATNDFVLRVTNTAIQFFDGTTIPAYIMNRKLMIATAKITTELRFGDDTDGDAGDEYVWKKRANGNLGLSWNGGGE